MKFRFIKYLEDFYVVVGITHDILQEYPDCYVVVPLDKTVNLFRAILQKDTMNVPFVLAEEVTDKNELITLLVLYG